MRELVSPALDAHRVRHVMLSLADSLSRVGRGRHHKKNMRQHRHQQEIRQIVRSLGLGIGALYHNEIPGVVVPDHVHQEAVQHGAITNSSEQGQILMGEDDDSMNSGLKEIDR